VPQRTDIAHVQGVILGIALQPQRLRQLIQERLRLLQIGGVEPPSVNQPDMEAVPTIVLDRLNLVVGERDGVHDVSRCI